MGLFGGGQEPSITYEQSPQQKQMYGFLSPLLSKVGGVGAPRAPSTKNYPFNEAEYLAMYPDVATGWDSTGQSHYNQAGRREGRFGSYAARDAWKQLPEEQQYNPTNLYDIPDIPGVTDKPSVFNYANPNAGYNIPDPSLMMPTQNWWGSLAPQVKAGLWAPYNEGAQQMLEQFGGGGMGGSPRGGYSGAAGAALGEYYQDAAKNVGLNAWQMTAPGAMAGWQAQLQRGMLGDERNYQMGLQDYQTQLANLGQMDARTQEAWRQQIASNRMPYEIAPALLGGTYASPVVHPGESGFNLGGMASGGLLGYGISSMAEVTNPLGIGALIGAGALGGSK